MHSETLPVSPSTSLFEGLEHRLLNAFKNRDIKTVEALVDSKCFGVGVGGREYSRKDFIQDMFADVVVRTFAVTEVRATIEKGFCTALANWEVDMSIDAFILKGSARVTRTWVERNDGWKLLSFHMSDARLANSWDKTLKKKDVNA